jgi:peptidoglycan/xylan/chitin deacetylase (PgdA/CDA1 family)
MNSFIKKLIINNLDLVFRHRFGIISHVMTEKPIAAITFDDGPDPIYTPRVLDILRKHDAHATFFMVGEGAHNNPDIVRNVAREGHAIGNHSWHHFAFPLIPWAQQMEDIRRCQRAIKPYGHRIFRPPYGLNDDKSNIGALLHGYRVIGWSLSPEDWREPNPQIMVNNLVENIKAGSIILLHDRIFDEGKPKKGPKLSQNAIVDREPMLSALDNFLEQVKAHIQFVTIPVLLQSGLPQFIKR